MRPVRVDSRMPKSEMSFRKESMRDGFADLDCGGGEANGELDCLCICEKATGGGGEEEAYISTMQLLVLMSRTLPPNW